MPAAVALIRKLGQAALDAVFPPRCSGCGASGTFLCPECAAALPATGPPRCYRCWRPGSWAGDCSHCRLDPPAFDALRSAFVYAGLARELVHALKYRGMTALGETMAALTLEAAKDAEADVVVPVPLSSRRLRSRGYNQAAALARPLARELGLPLASRLLRRSRNTQAQARTSDADERRLNVAGAFAVRGAGIARSRVLLVDDVTTTGATLDACAGALKEAGARSVYALTFARED